MRDLYCPRCGEPIDSDYLHDIADENDSTWSATYKDFMSRGCEALNEPKCEARESFRSMVQDAMYDLMGDDMDGIISSMEDFEAMGML